MTLKTIHALDWFFPESCGGTEVYVLNLAQALKGLGTDVHIVAPANEERRYEFKGIPVYRYPFNFNLNAEKNKDGFECFKKWLGKQKAQIYHQHSGGIGQQRINLEYAKSLKMKTLMTFHIANSICVKGTMLRYGSELCDGKIDAQRCTSCFLREKKVPSFLANLLSYTPLEWSKRIRNVSHKTLWGKAFSGPGFIEEHKNKLMSLVECTNRFIAIADWFNQALQINGISKEKISLIRSGINVEALDSKSNMTKRTDEDSSLNLIYLGRFTPIKGIELVVKTILELPSNIAVTLTIYAIVSNSDDEKFKQKIENISRKDKRIRFEKALTRQEILKTIQSFDFLVVPSLCFEMAPTVVMEAFAAGVPVIGHAFGGTEELVQHGINGWLISKPEIKEWQKAIKELVGDKTLVKELKFGVNKPNDMNQVAHAMIQQYQSVLAS